jgi:acyl-coenzyme A synthetase/AMP-(fatty) acid ligase
VFLPRDFIRLDRLPRSENGKLRRDALDLAMRAGKPRRSHSKRLSAAASRDRVAVS